VTVSTSSRQGRYLLLLIVLLAGQAPLRGGDGEGLGYTDPCQLRKLGECELEHIFAQGGVGPIPVGYGRGRVLRLVNTKLPRTKACMNNVVWKGKVFRGDGTFTNQWVCFQALDSTVGYGTSWFDGKPCILMEYPPDTPVFGNSRDELRLIGPNLYLGRFYERCPCGKLRGYFVLQFPCCCTTP
jgi:hypothetical protein